MCELMRKILYYENILEFKKNTKSALYESEVNNWRLCRTCLTDADESNGSVEFGRMTVMGMDGNLLSLQQMLTETTGTQILFAEKQPNLDYQLSMNICKDCLKKVTTMYFFKLQTKRAAEVLKRLCAKFYETDSINASQDQLQKPDTTAIELNEPDCCSTSANDQFSLDECGGAITPIETDSSETTLENVEPKRELTPTVEFDYELEEEEEEEILEQVIEEEHLNEKDEFVSQDSDLIKNLAELSYIEIEKQQEENEEISEEDKTPENDKETEDNVAYAIEQDYYLMNMQQLNYEINSCNNDAVVNNVLVTDDSDQECENLDKVKTDEKITPTKCTVTERVPKRKRPTKYEKPLLENLKCVICDKIFERLRLLTEHVQQDHPTAKAFKCRVCGNAFAHMQSLSRHMRHHKPLQHKYVCDHAFCGKEFLRPDDWKRHMRVHTGERPYACEQCAKAFKQPGELREHRRTHGSEKLFQCDICQHRLGSRNGLYVHKKAHAAIKNFICVHCEKRFLTNGELKSHTRLHLKPPKQDQN